jgi:hypothetical protein
MIQSLSLLIHADSKVGKTTLAATAPRPLILDAEGGTKFLPGSEFLQELYGRKPILHWWDPVQGPPPRHDGTFDICVVNIRDWSTVVSTYQWLMQAGHDFQSICVDSISEIQRRCRRNLKGTEAMRIQDWGVLLSEMERIIRDIRDLTLHPTNPLYVAMFIAESRETNGKKKPFMQGQIETALPFWMDIVGFLHDEYLLDYNGQPTNPVKRLSIKQSNTYEAGSRVQDILGEHVDNPNVTQMYLSVFNGESSS